MERLLFKDVLRRIRSDYGFTQEEAAENICSLRNYKRLEAGEYIPSAYVLNRLSEKFNYDFKSLYSVLDTCGDVVFSWKKKVSDAISKMDFDAMRKCIEEGYTISDTSEIKMTNEYMKALLLYANNINPMEI